jgi:hypothetical protein
MIVKITQTPRNGSSFARLSQYLTARVGVGGDRVVFAAHNTGANSIENAVRLIDHTQRQNRSTRADKTLHLVVSFPAGECPSKEVLTDISERLCESLGMADHQRLVVVHDNTSHLHMHLAINKIHPETKRCISPSFSKRVLYRAARELEQKHQLLPLLEHQRIRLVSGKAADFERFTGEQSFHGWMVEHVKARLVDRVGTGRMSWHDLHELVGSYGVKLEPRGRGLVFSCGGFAMKASTLDRSLSRASLERVMGPYTAPARPYEGEEVKRGYRPGPRAVSSEARELYGQYRERGDSIRAFKKQQYAELSRQRAEELTRIKAFYTSQRQKLWSDPFITKHDKRSGAQRLSKNRARDLGEAVERFRQARAAVAGSNKIVSWNDFLSLEASKGDKTALALLRSRRRSDEQVAGNVLSGRQVQREDRVYGLQRVVQRNGDVMYTVVDRFIDTGRSIIAQGYDVATIREALLIAHKRYGRTLVVSGDERFKGIVRHIAAHERISIKGLRVQFVRERSLGIER